MTKVAKKTKHKWDDILLKNKLFHRISWIAIPIVINIFEGSLPNHNAVLEKSADISSVLIFILIIGSIINSADEIYRGYEISKVRPIKGMLQVAKVVLLIIGAIILIALLIGESPLVLLGGVGAMTAVITLVFKDAILGFVAGIQLTTNDMIRIGDWIEMPKYSADGTVVDLSLTTVKVQNFDNTLTTVPAYALVSDAFVNWRGMENSGGRRIKRAIFIDAAGVRLCDDEMIERFKKMHLLKDYMESKLTDVTSYNNELHIDMSVPVNGRRLTNLGTFRAYISEYLKNHSAIHSDMILMVRQLKTESSGIPLEIYAFTNTTKWTEYERIQADIFDHLYSVISEFGLTVYQQPSGSDIRTALSR
ncbi:MAG: mechanosensitive ion channel protein MscS [Firmicutes bacterium HGW-Firmicutes-21]|nr:MAG: mechanosensitive ion channel protein MscS [Firmicutes bacterium HGW-Firmicutes-21]